MKKVMSFALASSMALSLMAAQASAAAPEPDISSMSVEQLAYMNTETASPALEEAILDARAEIIYGDQSWTVDGAITLINADGTEEKIPEFSELFPDWEIPEDEAATTDMDSVMTASTGIDVIARASLEVFVPGTYSQKFSYFPGNGNVVGVMAVTTPRDGIRYNLGFYNETSNHGLGWMTDLKEGQGIKMQTTAGCAYSIRASVMDSYSVGSYYMRITDNAKVLETLFDVTGMQ